MDQRPVEGLRRKNRALIYYLAAQREPMTRDQILAFFWPDEERPAAQQTLRTMLHDLRKRLGESWLVVEEDRLGLGPGVRVDARELESALTEGGANRSALASALERYRGDLLDGFTLTDTPAFDDWVVTQREYYRSQAIRGFGLLGHLYEETGETSAALNALTRALSLDPLREDVQRECLRLRYQSGDRAGAIRQYEALRKLLDDELGIPPLPETRALYDAIITDALPENGASRPKPGRARKQVEPSTGLPPGPADGDQRTAPLLPFTGRAGELEALKASTSAHQLILVEGAPGIGKTRLVDEFLHTHFKSYPSRPAPETPLELRGVAHELEQGLPYQPVIDALRGLLSHPTWASLRSGLDLAPIWLAEIARLLPELQAQFPGLPAAPQGADESRLWEGILQFLNSLAQEHQVILFLDDLHWADASTIGLLGYLARRAATTALLLIGTTRPLEAHTRLAVLTQTLLYEDRLVRISLTPLTPADTYAVAERLSPQHPDLLSGWLNSAAEGNPYFLTELLRHAYHAHLLQKDGSVDTQAIASPHLLPPTIQNLILSRLIRLSENARRVLDIAAVIGREFTFEVVYRILSRTEAALTEETTFAALQELQAAVLIQPRGGDRFSFDHSLTMEVALQDMGELRGRLLHRLVAQALEQMLTPQGEATAGIIAQHYIKGGSPERAAPFAFRAGRYSAGLGAWEVAIDYYQQCLNAVVDSEQRTAILIALGTAFFHNGNFAQSSEAFASAVDLARSRRDLVNLEAAYMGLNMSLLPQSRFAEAIEIGRDLLLSGPPELAISGHFILASGLSVQSVNPLEAEEHINEAERLLAEHPTYAGQVTLAHIKYQQAAVVGQQGKSTQAVGLYQEALDLVSKDEASLDLLRRIMLYNNLAYHLHLLGDPSAAAYARAGIQLAQERGSLTHMPYLLSTSGEIALSHNELDEAERLFSDGLRLAEQVSMAERIAGLNANLGLVAHRRGNDTLARQRLFKALELADQLGARHLAVRIRCWLGPLLPPDEAHASLEEARTMAIQSGFHQLIEEITQIEQALQ